ncbi:MAG: helix-turn-helix domain-containing protein [Alphaproteobacteria bacterium]|nr:helix-turn-helix domain-containing protein [Alphaproteobacteria bacterium]
MAETPTYCSVETVAHELDCSVSTVREYVKQGKLPQPIKCGALVRWRWDDIDRWMQGSLNAKPIDPILEAAHGT